MRRLGSRPLPVPVVSLAWVLMRFMMTQGYAMA